LLTKTKKRDLPEKMNIFLKFPYKSCKFCLLFIKEK